MTKPFLVVGAGGYAKEAAQIAKRIDPTGTRWNRISYIAVSRTDIGVELPYGHVDYCDEDILSGALTADVVLAVGEPHLRVRIAERYTKVPTLSFPNLIDPAVDYDPAQIRMGIGNVIHRNVTMTVNAAMGDLLPGRYRLVLQYNGQHLERFVEVESGKLTQVVLVVR